MQKFARLGAQRWVYLNFIHPCKPVNDWKFLLLENLRLCRLVVLSLLMSLPLPQPPFLLLHHLVLFRQPGTCVTILYIEVAKKSFFGSLSTPKVGSSKEFHTWPLPSLNIIASLVGHGKKLTSETVPRPIQTASASVRQQLSDLVVWPLVFSTFTSASAGSLDVLSPPPSRPADTSSRLRDDFLLSAILVLCCTGDTRL